MHVVNYNINLSITDFANNTINGYTVVKITPRVNGVDTILLDLLKLHVDSVKVNGTICNFRHNDTLLVIPLPAAINLIDTADVTVYYQGTPVSSTDWGGLTYSNGTAYNIGVSFDAVPHCFGRAWFPCIDDFKDRATFDCNITTTADKKAVCGGLLISEHDNGNGTITWNWKLTSPVPTYLASVAVSDYVVLNDVYAGVQRNIPITLYLNPPDTTRARASFVHLKDFLAIYETYFGPYRWERVGYVGIPFTAGAMEHATNIGFGREFITGDLSYESMIAHELAHHWFGDLVTCNRAEEMWLNEGWGEYCEKFFAEVLYGKSTYKTLIRDSHRKSIQFDYVEDNGYWPLSDIPMAYTYGGTSYNKGVDVIHTLRNFMGDSLFFVSVKAFLDSNAFSTISTVQLAAFLERHSGQDITGFIADWAGHPGYVHYSVDSFKISNDTSVIRAKVFIRQRCMGGSALHTCDSIELTFMNDQWQKYTAKVRVSGALTTLDIPLPFQADKVMVDIEEKVCDATSDCYKTIHVSGSVPFENTFFTLETQSIADSALVRVEHNWMAPDNRVEETENIYRISSYRYWKIDGIFPAGFTAKGRFAYNRNKPATIYDNTQGWLDHNLLLNIRSADSLVMLYRKNPSEKWHICNFTKLGGSTSGFLIADNIRPGEYAFGIGNPNLSGIDIEKNKSHGLLIYPNPSRGEVKIGYDMDFTSVLIYDSCGKMVKRINTVAGERNVTWVPEKSKGIYLVKINDGSRELCSGKMIVN